MGVGRFQEPDGVLHLALAEPNSGQVFPAARHLHVVFTQDLPSSLENAFQMFASLRQTSETVEHSAQAVSHRRHSCMPRPQTTGIDLERPAQVGLGLRRLTSHAVESPQAVEAVGGLRIVRAVKLLLDREQPAMELQSLLVLALVHERRRQVAQSE